MASDSDWMVDRRGWYAERMAAKPESPSSSDAADSAFDAMGYEAAYPPPLPPTYASGKEEQP